MIKLYEKLYIGKCRECTPAADHEYHYFYCCHWPCQRFQDSKLELSDCPILMQMQKNPLENHSITFFDLINSEIPNYRVKDLKGFLEQLNRERLDSKVVLISEFGESRGPSIALLWLAWKESVISRSSFPAARADFSRIYPYYTPWPGWVIFFQQEWESFRNP